MSAITRNRSSARGSQVDQGDQANRESGVDTPTLAGSNSYSGGKILCGGTLVDAPTAMGGDAVGTGLGNQVVIPASELVDGAAVTRLNVVVVDYLHLELDRHEAVLAKGLPAQNYLDVGNRADFAGNTTLTRHPLFAAAAL